ncbi:MAG: ABC-2 transporter permease [Phycisphaerales bacterium]
MSAATTTAADVDAGAITPIRWLRGVRLIAARELASSFDSPIAYVFTIAFVVLSNSIFMNDFFLAGRAEMTGFFELMPLLLAFFLPAITMRLWAEERRHRTIELLLTMPIVPSQAVVGKYLAALSLHLVLLCGSLPIVIMVLVLGKPDPGLIVAGYAGLVLLGAMFLAMGSCLSALSGDQVIAFVLATVLGFAFVLSGDDRVVTVLDGLAPRLACGTLLRDSLSIAPHFGAFVRGIVRLASVLYFMLFTACFLWLNTLVLRWIRT